MDKENINDHKVSKESFNLHFSTAESQNQFPAPTSYHNGGIESKKGYFFLNPD